MLALMLAIDACTDACTDACYIATRMWACLHVLESLSNDDETTAGVPYSACDSYPRVLGEEGAKGGEGRRGGGGPHL